MMTNFRGTKNPFQDANSGPELLGGYRWVPVGTGGYRWVPVGTGGHWLSLSITLLQTQIVTNLDCYKLRLLQTQIVTNSQISNSQKIPGPKNANQEEVLYEDSVKDLLKICLNHEGMD